MSGRREVLVVPALASVAALPPYVSIAQVAALYQKSTRAIERLVRLGRFLEPKEKRPMRWLRVDLEREVAGHQAEPPRVIPAWLVPPPAPAAPPMDPTEDRLIPIAEVCHQTGLSKTTVYTWMHAGQFPRQVLLGPMVRWSHREVQAWIAAQLAKRPEARAS